MQEARILSGRAMCGRLVALLCLAFFTFSITSAQPPQGPGKRVEEEEEKKNPAKDEKKKTQAIPPKADLPVPKEGELPAALAEAARKANVPLELRSFLNRLAVPYDVLTTGGGVDYEIVPLPLRELPGEELVFTPLRGGQPDKDLKLPVQGVRSVKAFEEAAIDQAELFLRKKTSLNQLQQIEAAIQALGSVEAWHRYARSKSYRTGLGWDAVHERLKAKIVSTRREMLAALRDAKKWDEAEKTALELIAGNPDDVGVLFDVGRHRLLRGKDNLKTEQDYRDLRDALAGFVVLPNAENDPMANQVRSLLRSRAKELARVALEKQAKGDAAGALQTLRDAESFDPDSADIKQARVGVRSQILYVGVPSLPVRMTPGYAFTDSERWAMELVFESLISAVPDSNLGRIYKPELAADLPVGNGLSRTFTLAKSLWGVEAKKEAVAAADVNGTLRYLKSRPYAFGLEDVPLSGEDEIEESLRIKLKLTGRSLEPLNRFTFKVLPSRLVPDIDSERFAKQPVGSGPYRFTGVEQEAMRTCAVFKASTLYGDRASNIGLPVIREIRLFVPKPDVAGRDFLAGQLHLWMDPGAETYTRTLADVNLSSVAGGYTLEHNRRIWMLAVNHRKSTLRRNELRRALAHAIDRDVIVKEALRSGNARMHQSLTGPFPPGAWPAPPAAKPLFQPELAKGYFAEVLKEPNDPVALTIRYCNEEPGAAQAVSRIKEQVETLAGPKMKLDLQGIPRMEFIERVFLRQDFELAYTSFDFKDDLFWLGGLLDGQAAEKGMRNYLGYLAPGTGATPDDSRLAELLSRVRNQTEFAEAKKQMHEIFDLANARMPFIPLWQIDRQAIVHNALEIRFETGGPVRMPSQLDPATLFDGIEHWRLR